MAREFEGEFGDPIPADQLVPWWEWQQGKRPPGWTAADEKRWQGDTPCPAHRKPPEPKPERHNPHIGPELQRLLDRIDDRDATEARRGLRDMALAPTLEIYQALQRGEAVPLDQLNPDAVVRYGLRRAG